MDFVNAKFWQIRKDRQSSLKISLTIPSVTFFLRAADYDIQIFIASVIIIAVVLSLLLTLFVTNIRKKAETKLHEQTERIQALVDTSQDWIWEINLDGKHTYSNPGVENILGYTVDELQSKPSFDFIHEDDRQKTRIMFRECIVEKKGWRDLVICWQHKDGTQRYLESNAVPVIDIKGTLKGFRGIDRDITESKLAMEQLRESEKRYRTLFESANDAIFLMQGNIFVDCNPKTEEIFACDKDKLIGQTPFKFSPQKQPDGELSEKKANQKIKDAFDGKPQFFEWQHLKYNGKPFDAEVSLNLLALPSGKHLLAIVRDITKRKFTEAALSKSEARYRRIVEDQIEFIVRWRPDGTRTFVNKSYCNYYGITPNEAIGTSFFSLVDEKDLKKVKEKIAGITKENPVSIDEHRVKRPDGTIGWNRWTDRAIFDEQGRLLEFQSVGMDITDSKKVEEAIRESEERFRILSESAFEGIVITEAGKVINANKKLTEMLHIDLDEIIGMHVFDFVAPESRSLVQERMKLSSEQPYQHLAKSKDGRIFPVEVRGKSMPYKGRIYRVTAIREISDLKK